MKSKREKNKARFFITRAFMVMTLACAVLLSSESGCFAVTVNLQWGNSAGSTGYRVYYRADSPTLPLSGTGAAEGASPIDVSNQTSATISGLDPAHSYYFAVTAYNAAGESAYSNVVSVKELASPTTSISYPTNNSTVSGTVAITSSAYDNVGVNRVEFYVNGVLQGTDTSSPYTCSWNTSSLAAGSYTLMTRAYDASGNMGQSGNVLVSVARDTTSPVVTLTSPSNNSTLSGTVTIAASASDAVGVSRVEFYANGSLLSAGNVSPYSYSWNTSTVANGTYTLLARVFDSAGNVGQSPQLTVNVNNGVANAASTTPTAPLAITTTSATATVGQFFNAVLVVSGVSSSAWSISSGSLPPGLSFNGATGGISGTPTTAGSYTATFKARITSRTYATRTLTITVNAAAQTTITPPTISTTTLSAGTVGMAYSAGLTASGGVSPYTWRLTAGVLPPGLALNGTTGTISGTATTSGTYSVTFQVTDSRGTTATRTLTITVNAAAQSTVTPPSITTSTLSSATVGTAYSAGLTASGGVSPYTWRLTAGVLPSGLSLNSTTGAITGTPTSSGTYSVTFQVADSRGTTASRTLTITVNAAAQPTVAPLTINTSSLTARYRSYFTAILAASGGVAPYKWNIAAGSLPFGMSLNGATGQLSMSPTRIGTYLISFQVTDSRGTTTTKIVSITVQ